LRSRLLQTLHKDKAFPFNNQPAANREHTGNKNLTEILLASDLPLFSAGLSCLPSGARFELFLWLCCWTLNVRLIERERGKEEALPRYLESARPIHCFQAWDDLSWKKTKKKKKNNCHFKMSRVHANAEKKNNNTCPFCHPVSPHLQSRDG
jgi:hypothetical protein